MYASTTAGINRAHPGTGETDLIVGPTRGAATRGGLYNHQGGGSALTPLDFTNQFGTARLVQTIGACGFGVCASDIGGTATWGNPLAQSRVGAVDAWNVGLVNDLPRVVIGISMGAAASVNYYGYDAATTTGHADDVAALILVVPVVDLDHVYQTNPIGARSGIQTAWGITWPAALPSHADPKTNRALLAGKPIRIYYATDDPICSATEANAAVADFGPNSEAISLGALGHTNAAIDAVDKNDLIAWLHDYVPTGG